MSSVQLRRCECALSYSDDEVATTLLEVTLYVFSFNQRQLITENDISNVKQQKQTLKMIITKHTMNGHAAH